VERARTQIRSGLRPIHGKSPYVWLQQTFLGCGENQCPKTNAHGNQCQRQHIPQGEIMFLTGIDEVKVCKQTVE